MKKAIIAGAGPAGLTCGIYLASAGWKVDVFSNEEKTESCLAEADTIYNYPGFPDGIGGYDLLERFVQQAQNAGVVIHPEGIVKVDTDEKTVTDTAGVVHSYDEYAEAVGCTRKSYSCEGMDLIPVHYCAVCDGGLYGKNDTVVVIGGGDTAISSALYLSKLVGKVIMLVRKPYCRYTNKVAFDELCATKNVDIEYETELDRISTDAEGKPILHLRKANLYSDNMLVDVKGLFVCIGCEANVVEHVGDGDVWKCGDCIEENKQVAIAVGSGARAALGMMNA